MSTQSWRCAKGGLIDRSRVLPFRFDDQELTGCSGDTLASALLANGIHLAGRSFKYHRPRGIFSAGPEEPNALVELRSGARREPNTRATVTELFDGLEAVSQNRWPTLYLDLLAVNGMLSPFLPAGFYYKTFMWPAKFWEKVYEPVIRRAAGLGRAARSADPDRYQRETVHCDVLVVGAGPAGLVAALSAAKSGARVVLAEQDHCTGGSLLRGSCRLNGSPGAEWAAHMTQEFNECEAATLLARCTVFGYYDHNILGAVERVADHVPAPSADMPRQRLWRIHAGRVILATGAVERPLVFGDNDRPGIMLASAARTYAARYAVRAGNAAVVFTNNDSAYYGLADMAGAGIEVRAVIDSRRNIDPSLVACVEAVKARHLAGSVVQRALGRLRVSGVEVDVSGVNSRIDCDLLCVSGGWNPDLQLHSQTGTRPLWSPQLTAFVPAAPRQRECSIGAATGVFDFEKALHDAREAGRNAARECGFAGTDAVVLPTLHDRHSSYSVQALWRVPGGGKALVDLQNDVADTDIVLAAREGFRSVEHLKRYTTLGMATDQGKLSNVNGLGILAETLGAPIEAIGTTTFRPPVVPVAMGVLAGSSRGRHFQPTRYTPMHDWHQRHGAVFVEAGQWLRPRYYPRPGEDMMAASVRETRATRESVGLCDVSTLGKIDIQGADAGGFLDRLYCNGFKSLPMGRARYGLMLREDGLVFDDGTTSRLADDHYFMTTTTAEAAAVMAHIEYCHQALWPELDVQYCSVTEQWAAMAIAGPNSRKVLQNCISSLDLSDQAFPFMNALEFDLDGIPARLFRISFSGELAFELNVPAGYGESLWQALMDAGEEFSIVAYGTESLGIMRIEKGHVAGPEINGQTTAADLGLGRMMSSKKDYIGRALAQRAGLTDSRRPQLVGIRCINRDNRLHAGAHLIRMPDDFIPGNDLGHVTSVTYSPMLDSWIALALLSGGHDHIGERLRAVSPLQGHEAEVEVVSPHFFDPENERLYG
jgi:methylglutamate dehydrogenase subunit C